MSENELIEIAARAEIAHDYSISKMLSELEKQKLIDVHWPKYVERVTSVIAAVEPHIRVDEREKCLRETRLMGAEAASARVKQIQDAERERCAKIADAMKNSGELGGGIAAAIRSSSAGAQ
jgi:hypothetical protein